MKPKKISGLSVSTVSSRKHKSKKLPEWYGIECEDHCEAIMKMYCEHYRHFLCKQRNSERYLGSVERICVLNTPTKFVTHDKLTFYNTNNSYPLGYLMKYSFVKHCETIWDISEGIQLEERGEIKIREIEETVFVLSCRSNHPSHNNPMTFLYCKQIFRSFKPCRRRRFNFYSTDMKEVYTFSGQLSLTIAKMGVLFNEENEDGTLVHCKSENDDEVWAEESSSPISIEKKKTIQKTNNSDCDDDRDSLSPNDEDLMDYLCSPMPGSISQENLFDSPFLGMMEGDVSSSSDEEDGLSNLTIDKNDDPPEKKDKPSEPTLHGAADGDFIEDEEEGDDDDEFIPEEDEEEETDDDEECESDEEDSDDYDDDGDDEIYEAKSKMNMVTTDKRMRLERMVTKT